MDKERNDSDKPTPDDKEILKSLDYLEKNPEPVEEKESVNLINEDQPQMVKIGTTLYLEERKIMIEGMSGLDINMIPEMKQKLCKLRQECFFEKQDEVIKPRGEGFPMVMNYSEKLARMVPVSKKYNLIKMTEEDRKKTQTSEMVYGIKGVLTIEKEEDIIPKDKRVKSKAQQLNLIDERKIHTASQIQSYQERMPRNVNKKHHPRSLKEVRPVKYFDPGVKFNWEGPNIREGPNIIKSSYPGSAVRLTDLDGREELKAANADRLKKYYT